MKDSFSSFHPIVNFLYFALVLLFSMYFMHPALLFISFASSLFYALHLKSKKNLSFILYMLPMMLFAIIINAAFNHQGITTLFYLPSGNPFTKESLIHGIASAFMLCSIFLWFCCFNEVISSDKFVYLFGKISPALSLVLSMTLRFVPRFKRQFEEALNAQKLLGQKLSKIKLAAKTLSATVSWALENSIKTSGSMKSRGYGLLKRTSFSIYSFEKRDKLFLIALFIQSSLIILSWKEKAFYFTYYPAIKSSGSSFLFILGLFCYIVLCFLPLAIDFYEEILWKTLKSNQ